MPAPMRCPVCDEPAHYDPRFSHPGGKWSCPNGHRTDNPLPPRLGS